jgi:hypothetical protein
LQSNVWQSGGTTMTLLTGPPDAEPYQGRHYLTLVDQFHDDGTLEGSTGWYDHDHDPDTEGEQVVLADPSLDYVEPDSHSVGLVTDQALTPTDWAWIVCRHWRSVRQR